MITIERTFPRYERHTFESVAELTDWAWEYAISKGCDADAYVRMDYTDNGEAEIIEDKDYTLGELSHDGWREVKE